MSKTLAFGPGIGYLDGRYVNVTGDTMTATVSNQSSTASQYVGIQTLGINTSQYSTIDGNGNSWVPLNITTNSNNFGGIYIQNLSNGGNASGDLVIMNDAGTAFTNYIDVGVNSSLNNNSSYTIQGAGAGYIYVNGGDMVMGTQSAKNIIFHTNGTLAANERMRITSAGNVGIGMTPVNKLDVTGNVGITQTSVNASLSLSTSGATASATLALASNGTVGGTGGATQITFSEGSNLTGQLICAVNNAIGNRYFGFIARTDRDGNYLPMRFFTFDAGGTARDTLYLGSNEPAGEQGRMGYGTSAPTAKHHFIQNAPASVSSGDGTAATTFLTMSGGTGGASTATGTVVGGAGASGTLTLGTGGIANSATVLSTGGAGGAFTITTGAGGQAAATGSSNNIGGISGALSVTGGVGGAAVGSTTGNNTGGNGGLVFIAGGRGGAASNANASPGTILGGTGGNLELRGGLGGTGTGGTTGNGGDVIIKTTTTGQSLVDRFHVLNDGTIGINTATPNSLLDLWSTTGATLTLTRNDISVTAADTIGTIQAYTNDTSTTSNNIAASITFIAKNTITTDINPGIIAFNTTGTGVAGALTERVRIDAGGNVGIGTTSPTNLVSLDGTTGAATLWMERHTTSNTAGNSLTVQAGGATSGATNKAGGALILSPGASTGTATVNVNIKGYTTATASGTSDNTQLDRMILNAFKALTNNSATSIVNCTIASGTVIAGTLRYAVEVTNGTDYQIEEGYIVYHVTNKAGTIANNTTVKAVNQQATTSGTLTVTFTITAANPAVIQVNANSSLTPSAGYPRITYSLENLTQQAVAIQ